MWRSSNGWVGLLERGIGQEIRGNKDVERFVV